MKAVVLGAYGGVERLEIREVPDASPGPREVLVRVAAASLNPIDWKLRSGAFQAFMPLQLPTILGFDASGEVLAVGSGVTEFAPGDRVLGLAAHAHAEKVIANAEAWATVPEGLDLRSAGALPVVVLTGAQLLEEAVNPRPGQTVLVTGALGSVGRTAVYAAKRREVRVLAGVRARQKAAALALGADGVVAIDDPAEVAALPPLDGIADAVGGATLFMLLPKVKPGGVVGSVVGEPEGVRERGLVPRAIQAHPDTRRLVALSAAYARGELVIPISKQFPLAQVHDAYRFAEPGNAGKVLLLP